MSTENTVGMSYVKVDNVKWEAPTPVVKEIERLTALVESCSARNESDADEIERLQAELKQANAERDNWRETAAQNQRNTDFYRDLITKMGEQFGVAARTSDDGSIQEDVLALKVPELVTKANAVIEAAREWQESCETLIRPALSFGLLKDAKLQEALAALDQE